MTISGCQKPPTHGSVQEALVGNADARDPRPVAKNGWRAGEVVEESSSGAKKNRRDVDVDFVEEASIQALLDGVSTVDPDGLPGSGALSKAPSGFGVVTLMLLETP